MSSKSNCTCTSSCITHESVTKNGQTVERTTKVDSNTDPSGQVHTTTTVTDTTIDPQGHKTTSTHTSTGGAAPIDFDHNDDFDAEFDRMKAKMDAEFKDFTNDHPALK